MLRKLKWWLRYGLYFDKEIFLKRIVRYKVYFDRARSYYSYITFFLVLLIAIKGTPVGAWYMKHLIWTVPLSVVLVFAVALIIGFFDKKYIRPVEAEEITSVNPIMMDVLYFVKDIRSKVYEDNDADKD